MIAKLQNPLFAAVVGLGLSLAVGVALSARALVPLLERLPVAPEKTLPLGHAERGWDFWTIEIDNLSSELKEERARLRQQAELLDRRAARVAAEAGELAKVRAEIERMRQDIAEQVAVVSADELKNVRTLAQTYATLTPRAAVAILAELDDTSAVKVLALMKAETVGPIFEEMARTSGPDGPLARRAGVLSERLRLVRIAPANPPN